MQEVVVFPGERDNTTQYRYGASYAVNVMQRMKKATPLPYGDMLEETYSSCK